MIVKVLGVIDIIAALVLFVISWGLHLPSTFVWVIVIILLIKSLFIFTLDIASFFDLFGGIILILTIYFTIPKIIIMIPAFLILQKGFLSVIA